MAVINGAIVCGELRAGVDDGHFGQRGGGVSTETREGGEFEVAHGEGFAERDGVRIKGGGELALDDFRPVGAVVAAVQPVFPDVPLMFAMVLARHEDQAADGLGLGKMNGDFMGLRIIGIAQPEGVGIAVNQVVGRLAIGLGGGLQAVHDTGVEQQALDGFRRHGDGRGEGGAAHIVQEGMV